MNPGQIYPNLPEFAQMLFGVSVDSRCISGPGIYPNLPEFTQNLGGGDVTPSDRIWMRSEVTAVNRPRTSSTVNGGVPMFM